MAKKCVKCSNVFDTPGIQCLKCRNSVYHVSHSLPAFEINPNLAPTMNIILNIDAARKMEERARKQIESVNVPGILIPRKIIS